MISDRTSWTDAQPGDLYGTFNGVTSDVSLIIAIGAENDKFVVWYVLFRGKLSRITMIKNVKRLHDEAFIKRLPLT